jgi:hypothetical protein
MKYLVILFLLLAPAMAQEVVYLDPCIATDGFLIAHVDEQNAFAAMTTMNLQARIKWAVECMGEKKATANQLRAAGMTVYLAQSELNQRLALASEKQHASDVVTMESLRSQAERASKDADYYRFAAASTPASAPIIQYETRTVPIYEPTYTYTPAPHVNCVATSTPLGQSVVTGVNCY